MTDRPMTDRAVKGSFLRWLRVVSLTPKATQGRIVAGMWNVRCALGRTGVRVRKREGDGATPLGIWPIRGGYRRADHGIGIRSGLAFRVIKPRDGWCDAPNDPRYNQLVRHPFPASAEEMWRRDDLYDRVLVLGANDVPRRRGGGSAIFMHLAREGYTPTAGCIAVSPRDMTLLLPRIGRRTRVSTLRHSR